MIESKELKLHPHQEVLANKINDLIESGKKKICVGAACGSGKTEISCHLIKKWLNEGKRILVLAHNQNVLKANFKDRLDQYQIESENLHVKIWTSAYKKENGKCDIIVIDEAHQYYDDNVQEDSNKRKKMCPEILKKASHDDTILLALSATPAPLVKSNQEGGNWEFVWFPLYEGVEQGLYADTDLIFSVANRDACLDDYNQSTHNLCEASQKGFDNEEVCVGALEDAINELINKVGYERFDGNTLVQSTFSFVNSKLYRLQDMLQSTLLVAPSQKSAEIIAGILRKNDISCLVSTSDSDTESENFKKFKEENERGNKDATKVLIVVGRGILGFDMPDLKNVIDMSYSINPNRIFQLMARAIRKSENIKKKYFVKVMPRKMEYVGLIVMNFVVAMGFQEVISEYTGDYVNQKVPQSRICEKVRELKDLLEDSEKEKTKSPATTRIDIPSYNLMYEIEHTHSTLFSDVAKTNMDRSTWIRMRELIGMRPQGDPDGNKAELVKLAKSGADRPAGRSTLGRVLGAYMTKSGSGYDEDFAKEIRALRPDWFNDTRAAQYKVQLLELAKSGADRPVHKSTLGSVLGTYVTKSNNCYDEDFDKEIKALRLDWFNATKVAQHKVKLLELARSGADRPASRSKLCLILNNYMTKNGRSYDEDFAKEIRALRLDWFNDTRVVQNKAELVKLAKSGADRPAGRSKLGGVLGDYMKKSGSGYDEDFDKEIKALRPDWFNDTRVAQNKAELVKLAKSGVDRPVHKSTLGSVLSSYVSKSHKSYDEDFDKEIRVLRPDWFKAKA
jgi:superfamily II DNA or RNA helicase